MGGRLAALRVRECQRSNADVYRRQRHGQRRVPVQGIRRGRRVREVHGHQIRAGARRRAAQGSRRAQAQSRRRRARSDGPAIWGCSAACLQRQRIGSAHCGLRKERVRDEDQRRGRGRAMVNVRLNASVLFQRKRTPIARAAPADSRRFRYRTHSSNCRRCLSAESCWWCRGSRPGRTTRRTVVAGLAAAIGEDYPHRAIGGESDFEAERRKSCWEQADG